MRDPSFFKRENKCPSEKKEKDTTRHVMNSRRKPEEIIKKSSLFHSCDFHSLLLLTLSSQVRRERERDSFCHFFLLTSKRKKEKLLFSLNPIYPQKRWDLYGWIDGFMITFFYVPNPFTIHSVLMSFLESNRLVSHVCFVCPVSIRTANAGEAYYLSKW